MNTLQFIIKCLNNKLIFLKNTRIEAESSGDFEKVISLDIQIQDIEQTLQALSSL